MTAFTAFILVICEKCKMGSCALASCRPQRGMNIQTLTLSTHGAQYFRGAASPILERLMEVLARLPQEQAGVRIYGLAELRPFLDAKGVIGSIAAQFLGLDCQPVRALYFDKTAATNWGLGWHQDRTICVKEKVDVEGYGPWTVKAGIQHVAPPMELLSRMLTVRVHLDDVDADNAPLLIAPGSHRKGLVPIDEIGSVVGKSEIIACLAKAGCVWAYSTPILHASDAATNPKHRRVLQVAYSVDTLPGGLEWLGV